MTRVFLSAALALTLAAPASLLAGCDSAEPEEPINLSVQTATDIAADPATRDPVTGRPLGATGRYTLYSLRENRVVLNFDNPNRADSASTAWDLGFRSSDIIVNGGTSGPGQAGAVIVTQTFDGTTAVPTGTTFRVDGQTTCPAGAPLAICGGDGNGWFTRVNFPGSQASYLVPTPGRTILVRTADGQGFAKVAIRSYYQGAPAPEAITLSSPARFYTFDFVLNPRGTSFTAGT